MDRLTKLEIQRALLAGRELTWTSTAGKRESIELKEATQRRLLLYLLQSSVREPKGLPGDFITGLSSALAATNDPGNEIDNTESTTRAGPWRLQKIETEGFGGLNTFGGAVFSHEFDGESLLLQGPNGSGKSSLVGAVLWAMTGERPREHMNTRPEEPAEVFDDDNRKIGTWPPIACYPDEPGGLTLDPFVRVSLTCVDTDGTFAVVERRLQKGRVSSVFDPALNAPDVLIETGLLMPSRMPQIRFEKGQTPLTRAVQSLTGLDDLIAIGTLVEGLCNKGREYLSTNQKEIQRHKELFEAALSEAQRAIKPTGETIPNFQPKDTDDAEGSFALLGKKLHARAAELTQVISDDLVSGLDLNSANVQMEVAGAISSARKDLAGGLDSVPTWKTLTELRSALSEDIRKRIQNAVDKAEGSLYEAIELEKTAQRDTRFQLKALGAHWHETNNGTAELTDCPLCEKQLENPTLKTEMESLRRAGDAARRQLSDNLNAIQTSLMAVLPPPVTQRLRDLAILVPCPSLVSDLEMRFISESSVNNALATFIQLSREALNSAPKIELPPTVETACASAEIDRVRTEIAAVRRVLSLEQWHRERLVPQGKRTWIRFPLKRMLRRKRR